MVVVRTGKGALAMDQVNQVWMQASPFLAEIWAAFRSGFYLVNNGTGILIAFVAALLMQEYRRIGVAVLGATVAIQAWEFLQNGFRRLPPLVEASFWFEMLQMALGFTIVITVFYGAIQLFNAIFSSRGQEHHSAH
jgi:hypothetical protein